MRGQAAELHERPLEPGRFAQELILSQEAIVLGSSQSTELIDLELAKELGIEVARRKGGGGAVWLHPGSQLWLELTIAQDDPLWLSDVGRAFGWVGELFAAAFDDLGVTVDIYADKLVSLVDSGLVCFGGLGPGEISVNGRKLVGISQRRTKQGSRFQCVVYQDIDHSRIISLFGLEDSEAQKLLAQLDAVTSDCSSLAVSITELKVAIEARLSS